MRDAWIEKRTAAMNGGSNGNGRNFSQMHYARQGVITEEMEYVAKREKLEPELVCDEVGRGRAIIPANIHHRNLEPMGIGVAFFCKINANIGNSATTSNVDEELEKLHRSVHYGSDTVMDLSTGGDIPMIRKAIINASPVPIGTVPIYEALSRVRRAEDLSIGLLLEVIEEQAEQGVDYMTIHAGVLREYLPLVRNRITGIVISFSFFTCSSIWSIGMCPGPSIITCTSYSQAFLVSSPRTFSSANCASSLASARQPGRSPSPSEKLTSCF